MIYIWVFPACANDSFCKICHTLHINNFGVWPISFYCLPSTPLTLENIKKQTKTQASQNWYLIKFVTQWNISNKLNVFPGQTVSMNQIPIKQTLCKTDTFSGANWNFSVNWLFLKRTGVKNETLIFLICFFLFIYFFLHFLQ